MFGGIFFLQSARPTRANFITSIGNEFDGFIIFDYFMIGNYCMQTYQTEMQLPVKSNVNGSSFVVISITEYLIKNHWMKQTEFYLIFHEFVEIKYIFFHFRVS